MDGEVGRGGLGRMFWQIWASGLLFCECVSNIVVLTPAATLASACSTCGTPPNPLQRYAHSPHIKAKTLFGSLARKLLPVTSYCPEPAVRGGVIASCYYSECHDQTSKYHFPTPAYDCGLQKNCIRDAGMLYLRKLCLMDLDSADRTENKLAASDEDAA